MTRGGLTRRRVLASLGAAGLASVGGLALATKDAVVVAQTMDVQSDFDLQADWRETYNGMAIEDTTDSSISETTEGPIISLRDVYPGDNGVLSFELSEVSENEISVEPELGLSVTDRPENGHTEPEEEAGDTTAPGELQEYLQVALWYDSGIGNIDLFGGQNGVQDIGEGLIDPDAEGTLAEVADAINGVSLGCLAPGESVTVSFGWAFESDQENINVTQGDGVDFDFDFTVQQC
ncbi:MULTISPECIES: hypothetical protein [Salinibaculum]|uniref:hypothetical protein n=1 Tax=Salinibaculum TaxID=2732368 RepID=UPI0030D16CFF